MFNVNREIGGSSYSFLHILLLGIKTVRIAQMTRVRMPQYLKILGEGDITTFFQRYNTDFVQYPKKTCRHLTPQYEVLRPVDPGCVELFLHPKQKEDCGVHWYEVQSSLKKSGGVLLKNALCLAHLEWYVDNQDKIPSEFLGKKIYAWASVVEDQWCNNEKVPFLNCTNGKCSVSWVQLENNDFESTFLPHFVDKDSPAGLISS